MTSDKWGCDPETGFEEVGRISNGKSASSYDSPATPIMMTHLVPDQCDH